MQYFDEVYPSDKFEPIIYSGDYSKYVESLLLKVLGESIEVELLAGDSQLESEAIIRLLDELKMSHIIAWRRMKGRVNPPEVLSVKDRIDVEGPD